MEEKISMQREQSIEKEWEHVVATYALSQEQSQQLRMYMDLLIEWNKKYNLTAILDESDIIHYHFKDSLSITDFFDVTASKGVVDIGSGAGFPGLPIKIKYPSLPMILLEVNHKKVTFLQEVIAHLGLSGIQVIDMDWRTFLRTTSYCADLFLARASLQPKELVRMFMPSSHYAQGQLCYWASEQWEPEAAAAPYIQKKYFYTLKNKKRQLVFFAHQ